MDSGNLRTQSLCRAQCKVQTETCEIKGHENVIKNYTCFKNIPKYNNDLATCAHFLGMAEYFKKHLGIKILYFSSVLAVHNENNFSQQF